MKEDGDEKNKILLKYEKRTFPYKTCRRPHHAAYSTLNSLTDGKLRRRHLQQTRIFQIKSDIQQVFFR